MNLGMYTVLLMTEINVGGIVIITAITFVTMQRPESNYSIDIRTTIESNLSIPADYDVSLHNFFSASSVRSLN